MPSNHNCIQRAFHQAGFFSFPSPICRLSSAYTRKYRLALFEIQNLFRDVIDKGLFSMKKIMEMNVSMQMNSSKL